jgi:acetyl esterase/lipase
MPRTLRPCLARSIVLAGALLILPTGHRAEAAPTPAAPTFKVREVRDVGYDPDADDFRHRLDLFLPKGCPDFPVLVLVHGGGWVAGEKCCVGLYSEVGRFFARHGVGAVLPNYRLSSAIPFVAGARHPDHVKDVARAFAWTREHIGRYGGDPDRLYVGGHSAGGHLAALLATDERYLAAEGLGTEDVKGVIAVSGVYRIPPGKQDYTLGGTGAKAFRMEQLVPLPDLGLRRSLSSLDRLAIPVRVDVFGAAFGDDPKLRADASPLAHVRPGLPPFLILTAEDDLPTLAGMATRFHDALRKDGCDARLVQVCKRNHNTILFCATCPDDPVAREALEFIHRHAR